jgi:hypothetical protein
MTARMQTFLIAHLPPELTKAFLQHVRDFDTAHPGCHFEIGGDAPPDMSLSEMIEMMRIDPKLTFTELFKR